MSQLYAEDLPAGTTFETGTYSVSGEEIVEFASRWDPLPIHVDERAAAEGQFGEVIACGAHVISICVRLTSDAVVSRMAVIVGRGIEEAKLVRPIRPGMTVSGMTRIAEQRLDGSDRGAVVLHNELRDEDGKLVMSLTGEILVRRRESAPAARTA